jgi:DNA-binding CsgD family transcriptional regulator/sugar-specific transcriptional regulator TrmB
MRGDGARDDEEDHVTEGTGDTGDATLEPELVEVYQALLDEPATAEECGQLVGEPAWQIEPRLDRLAGLCLVRRTLTDQDRWEALAPESAIAELVAPLQARAHQLNKRGERVRANLGRLGPLYRSAYRQRFAQSSTEVIRSSDEVRRRLRDLAQQAADTVVAVHPTMAPIEALRAGLELDKMLLERGVTYQLVWPHSARRQAESVDYMRLIMEMGGQVRTAPMLPSRMIVLDRTVALIPLPAEQGAGAAIVRDPVVLDFMSRIFEHIWDRARPVNSISYDDIVLSEIEVAVLNDLALGRTDESIARRLGIATRTLRRYLASLFERFGVETRFQLGVAAARVGIIAGDEQDDRRYASGSTQ